MGKHKKTSTRKLLQEISERIAKLEEEIDKVKESSVYCISVDKLNIEKLDNIIFHLDELDIKDLSGTLNMGNNFDIKKDKEKDTGKEDERKKKKNKDEHKEKKCSDNNVKFSNDLESIRALFKEITG